MPDTPKLGLPYPLPSQDNDTVAAVQSLANRLDAVPGIETFTTFQRDALPDAKKWAGRVIYNSSTGRLERWVPAANQDPGFWSALTPDIVFRQVHSWIVGGPILLPSGQDNVIPPMYFDRMPSHVSRLVAVRAKIGGGTSVDFSLTRNGTVITGTATQAVANGTARLNLNTTLAAGDLLAPVVTQIAGNPVNLTITITIETTAS